MKRAGRLFDRIAAPDNLLGGYLKARRGKMQQAEVRAFAADLDAELARLRQELLEGRCRFDRYRSFLIHDPKQRVIHAAPFRDRVLHHAVMNVCEPFFERAQIFDSYACRKGKGTRAAIAVRSLFARTDWGSGATIRRRLMADDFGRRPKLTRAATLSRRFSTNRGTKFPVTAGSW